MMLSTNFSTVSDLPLSSLLVWPLVPLPLAASPLASGSGPVSATSSLSVSAYMPRLPRRIWSGSTPRWALMSPSNPSKEMVLLALVVSWRTLLGTSCLLQSHLHDISLYARETDEVRMASSLAMGMVVQYTTTFLTSLVLAFVWSWSLTLVILSAVPLLMIIQTLSQGFAGPRLAAERVHIASAATLVDRAITAIATVKAFNAEKHEEDQLSTVLHKMRAAADKCHAVWSLSTAASQFVMMAMFVQAFWFGSKLVRDGTISPGTVMSVFWACLIATSNLQMCIPQLIVLTKGKFAMASLLTLAQSQSASGPYGVPLTPNKSRRTSSTFRKIRPSKCHGHFEFTYVSFAYPSRPTMPVLQDISIFLPPQETSFIVGGSGSGKSTLAQLLLRMYTPTVGSIFLDDQELGFLDEDFTREHVAAVSQNCILFDMSVHDNVAMGLAGPGSTRKPQDVTREEVIKVCRAALMHEFVRDLPDGYDTQLGTNGANLSGGQKQRLAIARALLRNPTVLILGKLFSCWHALGIG